MSSREEVSFFIRERQSFVKAEIEVEKEEEFFLILTWISNLPAMDANFFAFFRLWQVET